MCSVFMTMPVSCLVGRTNTFIKKVILMVQHVAGIVSEAVRSLSGTWVQKVFSTEQIFGIAKKSLSTSSLIWLSYTIRATIFEKVFLHEKFPKTEHFPTKRIISLSSRTFLFSSRTCKLYFPLESISLNKAIIAAIHCSLLEFTALIAIPHTSGLQAGQ